MCGIAGIYHYANRDCPVDRGLLTLMTRTLRHRGPDDEGFHVDGPIGLGHRRLSIVDLSPTGHQPMSNADGTCWITYNGEFYNHAEYRDRLASKGYRFRGTSDTETFLYLFEDRGPECFAGMSGIFGAAIWDAGKRQLTLVRDPLGVKQVYYYDDGKSILFASEIKALLACNTTPRAIDPEAVNQYLHFHTPLFERTFFEDIRQLRAGEYLEVNARGLTRRTYWRVDDFRPRGGGADRNILDLRDQIRAVVGRQLMSDVPVGAFFSGGIDSSAVAAFATRAGKPPQCFGVHFANQGVPDERPYQEAAAKALGLDLHLITMDGSTFPDDLMRLIYYQDQPVIGPAMFPMDAVSRLAARHVKVCLGGQGADELFGGYARYGVVRPWRVVRSWFRGRQASSGSIPGNGVPGDKRHSSVGGNLWRQFSDPRILRRLTSNLGNFGDWRTYYFENFAKVPEAGWQSILNGPELVSRDRCRQIFYQTTGASPATDLADKVMHWDMQTYLTGLFQQDDRMSMANSLESRVPLADPSLVQFAFHSGFDLKFRAGATKWILRQAVSDVLPDFVLNRRKVGFDTPVEAWMKTGHPDFVRDLLLSREARSRGIWNPKGIEDILNRPEDPLWPDIVWKAVCIEACSKTFLKTPTPAALHAVEA